MAKSKSKGGATPPATETKILPELNGEQVLDLVKAKQNMGKKQSLAADEYGKKVQVYGKTNVVCTKSINFAATLQKMIDNDDEHGALALVQRHISYAQAIGVGAGLEDLFTWPEQRTAGAGKGKAEPKALPAAEQVDENGEPTQAAMNATKLAGHEAGWNGTDRNRNPHVNDLLRKQWDAGWLSGQKKRVEEMGPGAGKPKHLTEATEPAGSA